MLCVRPFCRWLKVNVLFLFCFFIISMSPYILSRFQHKNQKQFTSSKGYLQLNLRIGVKFLMRVLLRYTDVSHCVELMLLSSVIHRRRHRLLFKYAWQLLDSLVFEKKRDSSATEMSHLTTSPGEKMVGAFVSSYLFIYFY